LGIREIIRHINASGSPINVATISAFITAVGDLARILVTKRANVSAPKNKKNVPTRESGDKRRKRSKEKLIRLNDLVPKQDVAGGHKLLFGATDAKQTLNNPTKET
jgi:hypothetical protein